MAVTYTISEPVKGEFGIGAERVPFEYAAGDVTAADDREQIILGLLADSGLAVEAKATKSTKPKAEAPAEAVTTEG